MRCGTTGVRIGVLIDCTEPGTPWRQIMSLPALAAYADSIERPAWARRIRSWCDRNAAPVLVVDGTRNVVLGRATCLPLGGVG